MTSNKLSFDLVEGSEWPSLDLGPSRKCWEFVCGILHFCQMDCSRRSHTQSVDL